MQTNKLVTTMGTIAPDYRSYPPDIVHLSAEDHRTRYRVIYPATPAFLTHHFPETPLYPLFIQLQWIQLISRVDNLFPSHYELTSIRCKKPLFPEHDIYITISRRQEKTQFSIDTEEYQCTTGTICVEEYADDA